MILERTSVAICFKLNYSINIWVERGLRATEAPQVSCAAGLSFWALDSAPGKIENMTLLLEQSYVLFMWYLLGLGL